MEKTNKENSQLIEDLFNELDVESMLEADASCGTGGGGCMMCGCTCFVPGWHL